MAICAFNKDGSCGVMKDTVEQVIAELIEQTANIKEYSFFEVEPKVMELGLVDKR